MASWNWPNSKSQNAPVPYPTMLHSEHKCAHFCSEWSIVGYGTGIFWDLVYWSIGSSLLPSRRPAITYTDALLVFIGDSRKIFVTFESIKIHQFSLKKKSIWKYCLQNVSLNGLNNMFTLKGCSYDRRLLNMTYRQACNISHTLVSNKIVDHSDAVGATPTVGASPVGVAPTASSYST